MANIDDIAVLTSENVRLNYTLAGMGSRVVAFVADFIILFLLLIAAGLVFSAIDPDVGNLQNIQNTGTSVLTAIFYFTMFLIMWGYYFFFEWINWGQTPGKLMMGIRVASADGAPAGLVACAIRNIVRLIDIMLAGIGVTFFILIFTPKYQRLGDLAAGTVVVRRRKLFFDEVLNAARAADQRAEWERRQAAARVAAGAPAGYNASETGIRIRIDDQERTLIEKFMYRRLNLPQDVRRKLSRDLAIRIRERTPGDALGHLNDEQVLETALASTQRPRK